MNKKSKLQIIFLFGLLVTLDCSAQSWFPLDSGLVGTNQIYDRANTLCNDSIHDRLWVAGSFQIASGDSVHNIAWWDSVNWHPLELVTPIGDTVDYGFDAEISSSIMFQGKYLFAADKIQNIFTRWRLYSYDVDSMKYSIIGTFDDRINAMEIYHDTLYVAGNFTNYKPYGMSNPTIALNGMAKWNGTDFVPIGQGNDGGEINALCVHNDHLIAGGFFEYIDGTYCKNIAEWNGSQWMPIGSGIGIQWDYSDFVKTVMSYDGKLYSGGTGFTLGNDLLYWDGTNWLVVSNSFVGVSNLKVFSHLLFVGSGASFLNFPWDFVTTYNDTIWHPTGMGPLSAGAFPISDFAYYNNFLYTGGKFRFIGDTPYVYAGFVARYDPTYLFVTDSITVGICEGDNYDFNGTQLSVSGIYNDTLAANAGIDSIVTLILNVTQLNPAISISNDTLTVSGNGAVQWYDCNSNQQISGATDNTFIPSSAGNYAAIITNGSCSDTTLCVNYTRTNELQIADYRLQIYPNPANETVTIILRQAQNDIEEVVVSNLLGVQMLRLPRTDYRNRNNSFEIDLSALATGVYF